MNEKEHIAVCALSGAISDVAPEDAYDEAVVILQGLKGGSSFYLES